MSRSTPQLDQLRDELTEITRDLVLEGRSAFFSVLHDIDFHHTADGTDAFWPDDMPAPDLAAEALELMDRMAAAIATARDRITQAMDQRDYLSSGRPLLCVVCGDPIDTLDFLICRGWAEHDYCHLEDPALEATERDQTVEDAEYAAYLAEANRRGPRHGDRVRLSLHDGTTREGWWLVRDQDPTLFLPQITTRVEYGILLSEGPAAEPMPAYDRVEVTELGEDLADYEGPVRADGSFADPATHQALLELAVTTRDLFPTAEGEDR